MINYPYVYRFYANFTVIRLDNVRQYHKIPFITWTEVENRCKTNICNNEIKSNAKIRKNGKVSIEQLKFQISNIEHRYFVNQKCLFAPILLPLIVTPHPLTFYTFFWFSSCRIFFWIFRVTNNTFLTFRLARFIPFSVLFVFNQMQPINFFKKS